MKARFLFFLFLTAAIMGCSKSPSVKWTAYSPEVMAAAKNANKPAVVDFYAAWCGPCMKMKETTFKEPRVIEALESFERVKMDMSFNRSEKIEKISNKFSINGLPTMIFFDGSGTEQARLTGFVSADRLLKTVNQLKKQFHMSSAAETPKTA